MYELGEDVYFDLKEVMEVVEDSLLSEDEETEEGKYRILGQLVLLKRLVDKVYNDGNHLSEMEMVCEYIDNRLWRYYEPYGFERFEDLELN